MKPLGFNATETRCRVLLRDFEQKGVLLSTEFRFFVSTKAYFYMGADILGVDNPDENTSGNFLNQYRANDRYSGGFSYVF